MGVWPVRCTFNTLSEVHYIDFVIIRALPVMQLATAFFRQLNVPISVLVHMQVSIHKHAQARAYGFVHVQNIGTHKYKSIMHVQLYAQSYKLIHAKAKPHMHRHTGGVFPVIFSTSPWYLLTNPLIKSYNALRRTHS